MNMKIACSTALALLLVLNSAWADTDTPETRRKEAQRYLQAAPPKNMIDNVVDKMLTNTPTEQRAQFKEAMASQFDAAALSKAMEDAMVKHFTTEEHR